MILWNLLKNENFRFLKNMNFRNFEKFDFRFLKILILFIFILVFFLKNKKFGFLSWGDGLGKVWF